MSTTLIDKRGLQPQVFKNAPGDRIMTAEGNTPAADICFPLN